MSTKACSVSPSLHWQQKSRRTDSTVCTWMLIRTPNSPDVIAIASAGCVPGTIVRFSPLTRPELAAWQSVHRRAGRIASLGGSLADRLAGHLGVKLLPQQFQDVVRELVPGSTRPAQLDGMQVGVRRDVGRRAVELSQGEPHTVWVHLD